MPTGTWSDKEPFGQRAGAADFELLRVPPVAAASEWNCTDDNLSEVPQLGLVLVGHSSEAANDLLQPLFSRSALAGAPFWRFLEPSCQQEVFNNLPDAGPGPGSQLPLLSRLWSACLDELPCGDSIPSWYCQLRSAVDLTFYFCLMLVAGKVMSPFPLQTLPP